MPIELLEQRIHVRPRQRRWGRRATSTLLSQHDEEVASDADEIPVGGLTRASAGESRRARPGKLLQPVGRQAVEGHELLGDAGCQVLGPKQVTGNRVAAMSTALQVFDERLKLGGKRARPYPSEDARQSDVLLEHGRLRQV